MVLQTNEPPKTRGGRNIATTRAAAQGLGVVPPGMKRDAHPTPSNTTDPSFLNTQDSVFTKHSTTPSSTSNKSKPVIPTPKQCGLLDRQGVPPHIIHGDFTKASLDATFAKSTTFRNAFSAKIGSDPFMGKHHLRTSTDN